MCVLCVVSLLCCSLVFVCVFYVPCVSRDLCSQSSQSTFCLCIIVSTFSSHRFYCFLINQDAFNPARAAGGKLFALSKAPKKGVRPIVVTDAVRALVGKTLHSDKDTQLSLTDYFTNIHPRVMQMAVGLKNGATIMQHLLCTLLGAHPEYNNASCEARNRVAVVTVDFQRSLARRFI